MNENFKKLVRSFYGSTTGNVNSPVWLCGLEWGSGYDPDIPILESELEPYKLEDIQTVSLEDFIDNFWDPKSQFCQNVLKVLIELYNNSEPRVQASYSQRWETLEELGVVGVKGLALILNAFPITFKDRKVADKDWERYKVRTSGHELNPISIAEWTGIRSGFSEYVKRVIELRSETFTHERKLRKPKLIICFGKNECNNFLELWGVENKNPKIAFNFDDLYTPDNANCFGYWAEDTMVVVVPFPTGSSGLSSVERIRNVCSKIYAEVAKKHGKKWLDFSQFKSSKPKKNIDQTFSNLIWEVRTFQSLVNQQMACINRIKTIIEKKLPIDFESEINKDKLELLENHLLKECMHVFDELKQECKEREEIERKIVLKDIL